MGGRWILAAVAIPMLVAVAALYLAVDNIARAGPGSAPAASPDVPTVISYQGLLADPATGDPVTDGTYNMQFTIYDAAAAGTLMWQEPVAPTVIPVAVSGGVFTVLLGNTVPLATTVFVGGNAYLEVVVNGETLAPRQRIASVAYAMVAQTLDGESLTDLDDRYVDETGDTMTGDFLIRDGAGEAVFIFDESNAFLRVGALGNEGDIQVYNDDNEQVIDLDAQEYGGNAGLRMWDDDGNRVFTVNGATGDVSQPRTGDGLAKAAAVVNANASVNRWFNNVGGGAPTVTKVTTGVYDVDFKFKVDDRYLAVSVSSAWFLAPYGQTHISYWYQSDNVVRIFTQQSDDNTPVPFVDEPVDWVFQVIIY